MIEVIAMNTHSEEGALYKSINVFGRTFDIYYGYYEEKDRYSKFSELIPVYPDFIKNPLYTDEGQPFVTEMQDVCTYYDGDEDCESCYGCASFKKGDELIGICLCAHRRK